MSGVVRKNEFKSKLRFSDIFKLFCDAGCVFLALKCSHSLLTCHILEFPSTAMPTRAKRLLAGTHCFTKEDHTSIRYTIVYFYSGIWMLCNEACSIWEWRSKKRAVVWGRICLGSAAVPWLAGPQKSLLKDKEKTENCGDLEGWGVDVVLVGLRT